MKKLFTAFVTLMLILTKATCSGAANAESVYPSSAEVAQTTAAASDTSATYTAVEAASTSSTASRSSPNSDIDGQIKSPGLSRGFDQFFMLSQMGLSTK
jgi:hypothetical protein